MPERPLTSEERQMLKDLHDSLMKSPAGSSDPPLIEDLRRVVVAYNRASWATRAMIWLIPTTALIGASLNNILKWIKAL